MTNSHLELVSEFEHLKSCLDQLIKKQSIRGQFQNWEEWFENTFDPVYKHYKEVYQKIRLTPCVNKPSFIDYKIIATNEMIYDCDMTNYD